MCSDAPTGGILDFCSIYSFFVEVLDRVGFADSMDWLAYTLAGFTLAAIVINAMIMTTAVYTWFERRTIGRFQVRLGPNRWGPYGLLQPMADLIKLMTKEDTIPATADRPVFTATPVVMVAVVLVVVSVIPFGGNSFLGKLNVGILFVIGITSVNTIAIFMGAWASRNKYAMFGAMRGVAMLVSYEVPMALAITGVLLISGSLSLSTIVERQDVPFLLVTPLGFLVFLAAASAEMSRSPFDQIEAESELGSGYNTEYSGIKFSLLFLAEFMAPVVTGLLIATLFLSGTRGFDPVPGQVWFVLKTFAVVFVMLWVRATWPRLRIDQIMGFAWKGLFALAIVNLFLVAVEVQLLMPDPGPSQNPETLKLSTNSLWLMAAINWVVTLISIVVMANVMGQRRLERPTPVPSPLANMNAEAD